MDEDFGDNQENTFILSLVFLICSHPRKRFSDIKIKFSFEIKKGKKEILSDVILFDENCQQAVGSFCLKCTLG